MTEKSEVAHRAVSVRLVNNEVVVTFTTPDAENASVLAKAIVEMINNGCVWIAFSEVSQNAPSSESSQ